MRETKYCQRCGKIISRIENADWYSHMSIKYCPDCRKKSDQEKTAERMKKFRARNRAVNKARNEKLELLEKENELLRMRIIQLREFKLYQADQN